MPRTTGIVVLILGVLMLIAALGNVFSGDGISFSNVGNPLDWPMRRLALMLIGVLLGILGAYTLSKPVNKKKKAAQ